MEKPGTSRGPKAVPAKNKTPAPVQITAEQLLREAKERQLEYVPPPPRQKISDPEELAAFRLKKRKEFEDNIRRNRLNLSNWIKYAQWEESQKEIQRARSIWERALDIDHRAIPLWLKYAEMEMRYKQINHARNIFDRALTILPRANQFWYKYTYMEEMLGNISGCRQIFERWMKWHPDEQAWNTYIKFELRYKEFDRAREIFERLVETHPIPKNWLRYARFEETHGNMDAAREIFERAIQFLGDEYLDEKLYLAFARFEEHQKEHDRATAIYKYALDKLPQEKREDIYKAFSIHEKKYGHRGGIEAIIANKRKIKYEEDLKENPLDYDTWFDYLRLLESEEDAEKIRDGYEKAIAQVPPVMEKYYWRRYIYLWINYALFEELKAMDYEKTRDVFSMCTKLIPHKKFTFAKIWLMYAKFEIRQKNLSNARKILGQSIGMCPKDKLFKGYIELEIELREFDRCRTLYEKYLEFNPQNCTTWIKYAELESILGDTERARAIYELAVEQPILDMPEIVWKAFIDFEIDQEEYDKCRELYNKLLSKTQHVKVWLSYAQFETNNPQNGDQNIDKTRKIYRRAFDSLKNTQNSNESRLMILETWKDFEISNESDEEKIKQVEKLMPKQIKKRRKIQAEDGTDAGWEEYIDYIFPDDQAQSSSLKLLELAKKWKQTNQES
ncbi:crooked neck 1 [Brachionus plicatilis]|uniref:Crooked neck 1 n=1 Tax=Brachionus plicatilis TaxID=10195 RepID=A0A3M7QPX5_BRAPC|nr:crooked neck 1 [Brachionus plicatilis]